MKKKTLRIGIPVIITAILAVILIARAGDPLKLLKPDPAFRDYITGYTSGVISVQSPVKIRLAQNYADSLMIGRKADPSLFSFKPDVSGDVFWVDSRTVEFRPSSHMKQNTTYTCTFKLSELMSVPEPFKEFVFQFHTIRQNYEVKMNTPFISGDDHDFYTVTGYVATSDIASAERVQEMVRAVFEGAEKSIVWLEPHGSSRFNFRIDSIIRNKVTSNLTISHNGQPIGVKKRREEIVSVPGTDKFSVLDAAVVHEPDQHVIITFSDRLDHDMDYDGMVRIGNLRNLRFIVDGNRLRVYPNYSRTGEMTLIVESGVRNNAGKRLGKQFTHTINFESLKPAVRMVGEGTILPSTNGLLFPFEAVNLNAVDVKIQKIYEKNVPQFLQVNELGESSEMYRVAAVVYDKRVDLTQTTNNVADFSQWHRYSLDLTSLIKPERGAIYRVILSYKRQYSTYPCGGETDQAAGLTPVDTGIEEHEDETWDFLGDEDDYWYYYYDYDWNERHDPCSDSYYYYKSVSRNILSSDIGLIAKAGTDGDLICYTTDIITAMPLADLDVEVLDFQMQTLATGKTDANGKIVFSLKRKPFLIIARRGDERGYLKLGERTSLSMSLFDVDGQKVRRGVKGFLYAERGVWRPGDTMFIHFILEDKEKQLPADVPVMFELSDPRGNVIRRKVANSSVKGIYEFHTYTDESSITGNYLGKVYIGNLTFTRYFKVETVKPNRLKIELRFPDDRIIASSGTSGTLDVRWLHGAMAPGLKADVSMTLEKGVTRFDGFTGFIFDDPTAGFFTETSVVFEGQLDAMGRAVIDPDIALEEGAPGVLSASFMTKVFEAGGDFSINTVTVPYYPFNSFAGLWVPAGSGWWDMLETGRQHQFRVANVLSTGRSVSSGKVKVEIYKIDWRWWWQNTERGLPYFLSNTEAVPVFSADVNISNGRGQFNWRADENEWGRYLVRVTDPGSEHSSGKVIYMDYPGWGRRSGQMREGASMLTISSDKGKYNVGDKVNVTIPSSLSGRALVSIETGSKVLRDEWIKTDSGTTNFTFEATPDMAPNVYVHITLLQPHRQTENDMPIRMYGVIPVLVEDPNTHLRPVITMPSVWEAESQVSITVTESQGRSMAYTLAIVDDGLLDLTNFKTPDPWKHFYGKEALGVKTWDLFAEVIGAMTGGFERLLSIGGGDTRINYDKQKTQRFTPVVKSFGPFYLEAGKRQTHTFRMPQYVGSVRVMVVAANEGAYGNAERTAEVKSPLMVLGTLPRVAGPGETVELPVNVFAMDKDVKNVQVTIIPGGLFEAQDATSQKITFREIGDQVINFRLKVKEQTGNASVNIVATSGSKRAQHTINLEVRNPNPPQVKYIEATLNPGESWNDEIILPGMAGTNTAEIELSSIPPLNLGKRLDYLIRYPHGCLEQTVSGAFPQLLLRDLIYLDKRTMQQTDNNIRQAIAKLNSHLMSSGTFAYWPGGGYHNEWTTSYAGHFMIEAEKRGFTLPSGLKRRWITAQKQLASKWQQSATYRRDDLVQAYRLYTLALADAPEMGAMNRLRNLSTLSQQAKWRLAAAYALAGKSRTAQNLITDAQTEIPAYQEYANTFGNSIRDKAMIVETMLLINDNRAAQEVRHIVTALNSQQWLNTQTTAYSLIAIASFYEKNRSSDGLNCSYQFHGKPVNVTSDKSMYVEPLPDPEQSSNRRISVKNNSSGTLFVRIRTTGIPMPGQEAVASRKIKLAVEYSYPDGKKIDPASIPQGKDFMAKVTVTNASADFLQEMALTHVVPSGWQIHNRRLTDFTDARTGIDSHMNYQDIRDDRILTYFNLAPFKTKTFTVMLNATFAGRFYMPAIRCEAMYIQDAYANSAGEWVEVVR